MHARPNSELSASDEFVAATVSKEFKIFFWNIFKTFTQYIRIDVIPIIFQYYICPETRFAENTQELRLTKRTFLFQVAVQ